jgi:hypothetical protein
MLVPEVTENESDSDVLKLDLFTKYLNYIENKQRVKSCYANSHLLYEHLNINFKELKYSIPYDYSKKLKECLVSKKIQYIIIPISLIYTDYAHYNIVIINKEKETFEYFEPAGFIETHHLPYFEVQSHIYGIINHLFDNTIKKYRFINAHINCPRGLQTRQHDIINESFNGQYGPLYKNNKMYSNNYGLCVAWCLLIIHIRILNPESNINEIVDNLVNKYNSKELNSYIRQYVYMIENSKDLKQVNSYISFDEHKLKLTDKEIKYNTRYIHKFKKENNNEMLEYFNFFKKS